MSSSLSLTIDHITYIIPHHHDDIDYSRLWFIIKQMPTNDFSFNQALKLALFWHHKNKYKCTYSAPIEKLLNEAELNYFRSSS